MINEIREELDKEKPDWLKISDLSKKMYVSSNKVSFLGIRENMINLVKVSQYNITHVYESLSKAYPNNEILVIGGWGNGSLTVTTAVKRLKELTNETVIIVSCKDALIKHLESNAYLTFRCHVKNRYSNGNEDILVWTNLETGEIREFKPADVVSLVRDYKLDSLL